IPGLRRVPLLLPRLNDEVVHFESWDGQYADSPRAIYEELLRRDAPLVYAWTADGAGARPPEPAAAVERESRAYLEQLGRSRYIVANNTLPIYFRKKRGAVYVQTWHGTPLKRIGLHESDPAYAGAAAHLRRMRRDVAKWDYLISASPVCTDIFRDAFGYRGEILETGSPRNDLLKSPDADAVRQRVRARLGITPGTTAVLYAPTWRDDRNVAGGGFSQDRGIDAERLRNDLPEATVLLTRMHRNVSRPPSFDAPGFVQDVSAYPSVSELYLAADVLVSDYSSVIYDFAVTGKPIVLFPYDLEHYERSVRGLYFEYGSWAPGPVVETSRELARALTEVCRRPNAEPDEAYAAFVDRFCPWEDGHASTRVWEAVLA
ncbi:MAG: CDP-glycerol glycerophosphotransferase family protein, partial [Nocardioidaceae bacterium]